MNDPIQHARRRTLITWLSAGPVIIAMTLWALAPIEQPELPTLNLAQPQDRATRMALLEPLELSGFEAPIWHLPEEEQPNALAMNNAAPAVRFPALELIAIVSDEGTYRAAIYLPKIDELFIAGLGEPIGEDLSITSVTADAVELEHAGNRRRFELKKPEIVTLGASG